MAYEIIVKKIVGFKINKHIYFKFEFEFFLLYLIKLNLT
jgi:hypothetical protein